MSNNGLSSAVGPESIAKYNGISITEWGPKTLSSEIKNIGNCTFPYPPIDDNPWFPNWKDLKPTGPMILDWRPSTIVGKGEIMDTKSKEKLARIKGIIEGIQLIPVLSGSEDPVQDSIFDKILEIIEE